MALSGGLNEVAEAARRSVADLEPGPLVVGLSGGPDSAIAAWACATTRPAGSVRTIHVDHGWDASPDLRHAAIAVAEHLGLPIEVIAVVPDTGASRERAAREARLAALAESAKGAAIVTGHHADDAVETVIGNLLRGAGLAGLAGIAAARHPFVRPLIGLRGSQLRHIAEELQLPFIDDPSNSDISLRRNLIRHRILPELDRHIDGDLIEVVGRSALHLAAADAYLDDVAPTVAIAVDDNAMLVAVAPLVAAPAVLAQQAIRGVLRVIHPPYPGTTREITAVLAVASGSQPRADLSGGVNVDREGPHVAFYVPQQAAPTAAVDLSVPGRAVVGSHVITASEVPTGNKLHMSHDRCRIWLTEPNLLVRAHEPGDTIDIGGGSKTVADALNEAAVPVRKRLAWPVVEHRGRIVWVAGVRVAAWARAEAPGGAWIELERRVT